MDCIKFLVYGKVQKVYYRKYVSNALTKAGFSGYIKNLSDGSVELIIKKEPNLDISLILNILYEGSPKSEVKSVEMAECNEELEFKKGVYVRY